jgi:S1-C subfamily serine protease
MNPVSEPDLRAWSHAVSKLIEEAGTSVVAVRSEAYRVNSGVVIAPDLIAVNDHALRREGALTVHLPDGGRSSATILGRDPSVDVAILKTETGALTPVTPEPDDELRPGAFVVVVGRTLDAGLSASTGILGAVSGPKRTWRAGTLDRFLRLDANVYPSQNGAAVISAAGKFVGMANAALLRHSAVAVPLATLRRVADELVREGRIRKGYLGVGLQPVRIPEHLRKKTTAAETGLMVISVEPASPAEEAGLQLGDVLTAASGQAIADVDDLQAALGGEAVGKPVRVSLLRAGEPAEVEIVVGERASRRK